VSAAMSVDERVRELAGEVKALQAENVDLRVMLAEMGVAVPAGVGALSLARVRAFEGLRFWADRYLRRRRMSPRRRTAAIVDAERRGEPVVVITRCVRSLSVSPRGASWTRRWCACVAADDDLPPVMARFVEETDHDPIVMCADDCVITQAAVDAVLGSSRTGILWPRLVPPGPHA